MRLPVGTRHPLVMRAPSGALGIVLFPFWAIPAGIGWVWMAARFHSRKCWRWRAGVRLVDKLETIDGPNRGARVIGYLRKVDPLVFEEAILEAHRRRGYPIIRNARYSGDGGIDGRIFLKGRLVLVQAKRYQNTINPAHVEAFARIVQKHGAKGGIFVHTGRTGPKSKEAKAAASSKIAFVSGDKLVSLFTRATPPG